MTDTENETLSSPSFSAMSLAEKTAYAEKLEEMLRVKLIKIAHYDQCVLIEISATLALNHFQQRRDLIDCSQTKAWNDRFAAESAAYPPTLESILWIVAKSGYTKEVAPFMNLSKATRECKNLQRVMREDVEASQGHEVNGDTCLITVAWKGHLDIRRLLIDKGADIEAKDSDDSTPLGNAAPNGHIEIVRLLCNHGADVELLVNGL